MTDEDATPEAAAFLALYDEAARLVEEEGIDPAEVEAALAQLLREMAEPVAAVH